jgi:gliding motility-associated-like protein
VKFKYVFGSEEYPEYACTNFNDVFAFFISGPGYATPKNIALIPGTNIPVSINSVNPGPGAAGGSLPLCTAMGPGSPFTSYYVNNSTSTTVIYDGLVQKLTAYAAVTPCDTYHLKIGIADGTDYAYDSGVFIEAGSLTSTGISVAPLGINPLDTTFGGQYCVRGCVPAKFIFKRTGSLANPFVIKYNIGGTAINGYDYAPIADSVIIPAADSMGTVLISGLIVPPAGPKTVKLYILSPYNCGGGPTVVDSATIIILDSFRLAIQTPDTNLCQGQIAYIRTLADTLLRLHWSPSLFLSNDTIPNPVATPTMTITYTVTGDFIGGGCPQSKDKITITVYNPPILTMGPFVRNTCIGVPIQFNTIASPPSPGWIYSWSPGTYLSSTSVASPTVTPTAPGNTVYHLTVSAPVVSGCSSTDSVKLHVVGDFTLNNLDTSICFPPGTYQIRAFGDTERTYRWTPPDGISNPNIIDPMITPIGTTIYSVTASYPGCPDLVKTLMYSVQHPEVDIINQDTTVCTDLPFPLTVRTMPVDSPFTFAWSSPTTGLLNPTELSPSFFMSDSGIYSYEIVIQSGLGCTDTDRINIMVSPPVYIRTNPMVTTTIKYGEQIQLDCINMGRHPLFYYWIPNNGSLTDNNINNPVAKPLETTLYTVFGMNEWGCRDTAYVTIEVDSMLEEYIPTAFTPNGDGRNDVFRIGNLRHRQLVDFKVFNRWGEVIYQNTSDPSGGWDGTFKGAPQDMGVYHYLIIIGKPGSGGSEQKVYKGDVTLIR